MLKEKDLQKLVINKEVVERAKEFAEAKLKDVLETKEGFDAKSTSLIKFYLASIPVILGANKLIVLEPVFLSISVIFILAGVIVLVMNFCSDNYGAMGTNPRVWLRSGVIDAKKSETEKVIATNISYILCEYEERIEVGVLSNERKSNRILSAIIFGTASCIMLVLSAIFTVHVNHCFMRLF